MYHHLSLGSISFLYFVSVMADNGIGLCINKCSNLIYAIQNNQSPELEKALLCKSNSYYNYYVLFSCFVLLISLKIFLEKKFLEYFSDFLE